MQQPNIPYDQTLPVECDECGHNMFVQALHLRKASGLLTGTGQTSYVPIPVFACMKCDHVNVEFLPKEAPSLGVE
jgi:hypothetical protein